MTQAIQKKETGVQSIARQLEYSSEYVETVKNAYAKGATDLELQLFLQTAKRTGLDPMARQIYCIQRYSGGVKTMSTQVSIDGFRLIADRTGNYVPGKEPTYTLDENGDVVSATAYIKKFVGGIWHEVSATAFFAEYVQTTKDGNPNSMWRKMPRLMLAKVAESLVLRKAFPAELSGLYTSDEMGAAEIVSEPTQTPVAKEKPLAPKGRLALIQPTLTKLNANNDSIKWSPTKMSEYLCEMFDDSKLTLDTLSAEQYERFRGDLEGRLIILEEQEAISAVDGEIIEEISADKFEEEVF